jgi:hypothetical protein
MLKSSLLSQGLQNSKLLFPQEKQPDCEPGLCGRAEVEGSQQPAGSPLVSALWRLEVLKH